MESKVEYRVEKNLPQLEDETTSAAVKFFRLVRGLEVKERWRTVVLGEVEAALGKWVEARGNEEEARRRMEEVR